MTTDQNWTNPQFLLGKSAIKMAPKTKRDDALNFAKSASFIFGARTPAVTVGDSLAQVLGMISALLGEQLTTVVNFLNASETSPQRFAQGGSTAFHSFYPSAAVKQEPQIQAELSSAQAAIQNSVRKTTPQII